MIKKFFLGILISLILGFVFIFIISKFIDLSTDVLEAIIIGTVCAMLYVSSGFFASYFAGSLSQGSFNKIFILSIIGRFIILTIGILLIIKILEINTAAFLISFFIWFFIFQIWEVISLNRIFLKKI